MWLNFVGGVRGRKLFCMVINSHDLTVIFAKPQSAMCYIIISYAEANNRRGLT